MSPAVTFHMITYYYTHLVIFFEDDFFIYLFMILKNSLLTAEQCGRRTLYVTWPAVHSSHPYSTWQVRRGALQYEICDKEEQELHFPPLLRLLLLLHLPLIPLLLPPFFSLSTFLHFFLVTVTF